MGPKKALLGATNVECFLYYLTFSVYRTFFLLEPWFRENAERNFGLRAYLTNFVHMHIQKTSTNLISRNTVKYKKNTLDTVNWMSNWNVFICWFNLIWWDIWWYFGYLLLSSIAGKWLSYVHKMIFLIFIVLKRSFPF